MNLVHMYYNLEHGENSIPNSALYFQPFRVRDLVDKIQVLDRSETLRRKISNSGRARAISRYSWDDHVDRLVDTFKAVAYGV